MSCHGAEFTRMAQGSMAKDAGAGAGASALGTATDLQTDPIAFAAMESPAQIREALRICRTCERLVSHTGFQNCLTHQALGNGC